MPITTVEVEANVTRPEFFRLPKPGRKKRDGKRTIWIPAETDPFFGFSRSFYYNGEKRAWWRLIRIRGEAKKLGVTLIRYADIAAFVRSQINNRGKNTNDET